ncbi:MAG TPA: 16S rRNA (adenine(1518)-N(6)/adenine(1519)-N(6))-dimethyltransferase RsmA [Solirubrobacteraceae bacterium]|nr:16S rRNA (adenine(1518)-N(6)/adenine(1519)-N(6))-dimethyltransferase RsmA [Solirubrobacteraceae bacterium]
MVRASRAREKVGVRRTSATGRPAKDLGQNFLVDPNILDVIGREADLSGEDVVLEVGAGEGMLSGYLAPRVRWLHVVEIDERLRERLTASVGALANVSVLWEDAMKLDLSELEPPPTKLVANLPYGVAAGVVLRTIEQLPSVGSMLVMVQREVGERFAAAPGGKDYGITSVLAQIAGEVKVVRRIPRTVFRPAPNVDSVLLRIVRIGPGASPGVKTLVGAAFAHRRKALARSSALAGVGPGRETTRAALAALGHPEDVRAERLAPAEFVALAEALGLR